MKVLDKGFIELCETMGTDETILECARISFANDEKTYTPEQNVNLMDYLIRNEHWSPVEMCELRFKVKLPIFVARQWMRHRTGSFNEWSGRYTELPEEYYEPLDWYSQGLAKQGRSDDVVKESGEMSGLYGFSTRYGFATYKQMTDASVAKEMARMVLPLSTYTMFYWKTDLRNLFNFLRLRLHPHAQAEIREYAKAILELTRQIYPMAVKIWENRILNAETFNQNEIAYLLDRTGLSDDRDIRIIQEKLKRFFD